jgi:hypothetical protein
MGYYVRAFCTGPQAPELAAIQRWLQERGSAAILDEPTHAVEAARTGVSNPSILALNTSEWKQVAVAYKPGRLPILAECNRDDGTVVSLLRQEIEEFKELIEDATPDEAKQRVLRHLEASKFIIACQLPTSDIDKDGYDANSEFLAFFTKHCGGMIQADGEGFYDDDKLILSLA